MELNRLCLNWLLILLLLNSERQKLCMFYCEDLIEIILKEFMIFVILFFSFWGILALCGADMSYLVYWCSNFYISRYFFTLYLITVCVCVLFIYLFWWVGSLLFFYTVFTWICSISNVNRICLGRRLNNREQRRISGLLIWE